MTYSLIVVFIFGYDDSSPNAIIQRVYNLVRVVVFYQIQHSNSSSIQTLNSILPSSPQFGCSNHTPNQVRISLLSALYSSFNRLKVEAIVSFILLHSNLFIGTKGMGRYGIY
ncbi:hypothetical protein L6452_38745 [Arctium lappa]|uniref:Uncharacterized protein n=1 Tax=Arctium lappa TaxID=4217 RepID=A0ACB8XUH6_ARCLA|nr:hypothetical protein L6452_38745 [Arctium lappa]